MPALVATSGPLAGQRFELGEEITLGREAGVVLPDDEASRRHATVRPDGRGAVIEDLGSLNGTFVDGARISGPVTLSGGERIRIGSSEFRLEPDPEPEPEPVPEPEVGDPGATRLHAPPPTDATVMEPTPGAAVTGSPPAPPAPDATTVRPRPQEPPPDATTVRARPAPPPPPAPEPSAPPQPAPPMRAPEPAAPGRAPAATSAAPAQPFGALAPSGGKPARRKRGAATRLVAPTLATYAVIVATAVALFVYFAGR